jgi:hypothetical protein
MAGAHTTDATVLKSGTFLGASIRIRRVKTTPENASLGDLLKSKACIEFANSEIRISAFYGEQGEFLDGRILRPYRYAHQGI